MSCRNSPTLMPEAVKRYRFCGLPTGVNILPRFAAMVMSVATRHMRPSMPARRKTTKASGTNVMSATSLVTAMLAKNASPTSTPATARCVRARATNHAPTASNTPSERNPATTAIRQNSNASVCQSTYAAYPASGGTRAHDAKAAATATTNTVSRAAKTRIARTAERRDMFPISITR